MNRLIVALKASTKEFIRRIIAFETANNFFIYYFRMTLKIFVISASCVTLDRNSQKSDNFLREMKGRVPNVAYEVYNHYKKL